MNPTHRIRCRYCTWETPSFVTGAGGAVRPGMARLRNHIESVHPVEYEAIYEPDESHTDAVDDWWNNE